jgi:hypothetical protein
MQNKLWQIFYNCIRMLLDVSGIFVSASSLISTFLNMCHFCFLSVISDCCLLSLFHIGYSIIISVISAGYQTEDPKKSFIFYSNGSKCIYFENVIPDLNIYNNTILVEGAQIIQHVHNKFDEITVLLGGDLYVENRTFYN